MTEHEQTAQNRSVSPGVAATGSPVESDEVERLRADNERLRALLGRVLDADSWDEIRVISREIRGGPTEGENHG